MLSLPPPPPSLGLQPKGHRFVRLSCIRPFSNPELSVQKEEKSSGIGKGIVKLFSTFQVNLVTNTSLNISYANKVGFFFEVEISEK